MKAIHKNNPAQYEGHSIHYIDSGSAITLLRPLTPDTIIEDTISHRQDSIRHYLRSASALTLLRPLTPNS
jgi:hypothetical protein